jgi:hypothetical protein
MAKEITYERLFKTITDAIRADEALRGKTDVDGLIRWVEHSKRFILGEYGTLKSIVKTLYMEKEDGLLDRHKCSACFTVAFARNLSNQLGWEKYENYRERLAIFAGLTVMATFIMGEPRNDKNAIIQAILERHKKLDLPDTLCDTAVSYYKTWALELRDAYKSGGFSVFSVANELFLLEQHNRDKKTIV